jgi:hypothetical protein
VIEISATSYPIEKRLSVRVSGLVAPVFKHEESSRRDTFRPRSDFHNSQGIVSNRMATTPRRFAVEQGHTMMKWFAIVLCAVFLAETVAAKDKT